jgi:hypothetical protein
MKSYFAALILFAVMAMSACDTTKFDQLTPKERCEGSFGGVTAYDTQEQQRLASQCKYL